VRYTRDGSDPNASSPELEGPLVLRESVKLALRGFEGNVGSPFVARAEFVVLTERDALEPIHFIRAPDPGFAWRRYDQRFQSVAQFCDPRLAALLPPPDAEGRVAEVGVEPASKEPCALIFEGHLSVAKTGLWRFATTSDDGSRVWIGDHLVVDNDGLHGATRAEGAAVLKPGYYPIRVAYFDAGGGRELKLEARAAAPGAVRD
jgi:hexosaminidase